MTLTRAKIAEAVFNKYSFGKNLSLSQVEAHSIVLDVLEQIKKSLAKGEKVKISNFGVFYTLVTPQRIGRNPKKPQDLHVIEERTLVKFKASFKLKDIVDEGVVK